jgi:hypothetical protein
VVDLDAIYDLVAPTRYDATTKINRPPTLRSVKSVLRDGVLPYPLAP